MHVGKLLTITTLLVAMTSLSGCYCVFGCIDHIGVQRDYIEVRDECQDAAELRMESYNAYKKSSPDPFDTLKTPRQRAKDEALRGKQQKGVLFNMFKDCMGANDWVMSKPKDDKKSDIPNIIDTARKRPGQQDQPNNYRVNVGK